MAKVWKMGDDVNTDEIIACEYYPRPNNEELGKYALIKAYPGFAKDKQKGDILIAGRNFGCGSSREYAALALKYTGIRCVIAKSFARIFYRNCINVGFPMVICEGLDDSIKEGDEADVDLTKGIIIIAGKSYKAQPLPEFVLKIADAGGIVNFLKKNDFGELKDE